MVFKASSSASFQSPTTIGPSSARAARPIAWKPRQRLLATRDVHLDLGLELRIHQHACDRLLEDFGQAKQVERTPYPDEFVVRRAAAAETPWHWARKRERAKTGARRSGGLRTKKRLDHQAGACSPR